MLPVGYALRNLYRDPARMLQTILGSALVVLLVMGASAVNQGMDQVLASTGSTHNVMLMGAGSEESIQRSEVADRAAGIAEASIPGIFEVMGTRAVSREIHHMAYLHTREAPRPAQALVRGVTAQALLVHPQVVLLDGRFPGPGELMVGRLAYKGLGVSREALALGQEVQLEGASLKIVGHFGAPGTVMESEVWADLNDLRTLAQRETLSGVVVRMVGTDLDDASLFTKQRLDLELIAMPESRYYENISRFYAPIRGMTWLTASLIALGALLGGFNTLYAAFASRIAELATLQTIGFGRPAIFFSLVQESLIASLLGTLLASFLGLWLFDGMTLAFSMGSFTLQISPEVALLALLTGVLLGIFGAVPPALRCLIPPLPEALRASS